MNKKFAAFDIDGTLIRWQLYHTVVDKLAVDGLLGDKAHKQLHQARMVWKRREHPDAFKAHEKELIKVYEQALPNLTTKQFDEAVQEVASEYKAQVYTYTRDLARSLKKQDYFLIAISGSHYELVEHVAKQFDFDEWVGTEYERKNGRFTGKAFIASIDKKTILNNLIDKHSLSLNGSYAVGDSKSDAPMLETVENPIAFNPDQELFDLAKNKGWPIVVERKNVVYELGKHDGKYELIP